MVGKKGMSSEMIWIIIILILALLLLVVFGKPSLDWIGKTVGGFGKQAEVSFADCDLDRIQNEFDECPCIQRGETPHKDLLGCPAGTTYEVSVIDRTTCFQYESLLNKGTFVAECDGNSEECKTAKTKCDTIAGTVVAEAKKTGDVATNGDLELTSFQIGSQIATLGVISFDLENQKSTRDIGVGGKITNKGSETILHSFTVKYYVCSSKDKTLCNLKKIFTTSQDTTFLNIDIGTGLNPGNSVNIPPAFVRIGEDADYCEAYNECYLKIKIDADNTLSELNEDDNEQLQFIALKNIKKIESSFTKLQIVAVIDDGTNGGVIDEYRLSEPWPRDEIITFLGGSVDGDLPYMKPTDGSCWIFTVDDDNFDDNVGAGSVAEGTIISSLKEDRLSWVLKYDGSERTVVDVVDSVFNDYPWKAKTDGSIICSQGDWLRCSAQKSDAVLIGTDRFTCRNQVWSKE